MKNQTKSTKEDDIERGWHLYDVKDKVLGRISTEIAQALMGKHKPYYVRHLDCGDFVVVINAKEIAVTGKKEEQKLYSKYSGYPSGLKQKPLWRVRKDKPTHIVKKAVYGMLPKNKLRKKIMTRLYIFEGSSHPHSEQFKGK